MQDIFGLIIFSCIYFPGYWIAQKLDKKAAFLLGWVLAFVAARVLQNIVN